MTYTVRRAVQDDAVGVQRSIAASWRDAYADIFGEERLRELTVDSSEFYPEARFREKLSDDDLAYLVALINEGVVGIVNVCWAEGNTHDFVAEDAAQVRSLYVHPDHWNRGIGSALLAKGTAAQPDDIDRQFVECLADNPRAREFYEARGFERIDEGEIDLYGVTCRSITYKRG